jgi:hypothetical protein
MIDSHDIFRAQVPSVELIYTGTLEVQNSVLEFEYPTFGATLLRSVPFVMTDNFPSFMTSTFPSPPSQKQLEPCPRIVRVRESNIELHDLWTWTALGICRIMETTMWELLDVADSKRNLLGPVKVARRFTITRAWAIVAIVYSLSGMTCA